MVKKLIFLSCILLLVACELEKEIDFNTKYKEDKIVVNGFISPENGVQVIVKKTVAPNTLDADDRLINPEVLLFENGINAIVLHSTDGYSYTSSAEFVPKVGSNYHIVVQSDELGSVVSTPQLLFNATPIDTFKLLVDEQSGYANLVLTFNDALPFDAGFLIKNYNYFNGARDSIYEWRNIVFDPFSLVKDVGKGINNVELYLAHTSELDSTIVELYTFSNDFKQYCVSYDNYDMSKNDPFFDRPYPVYSNIDGGFGVFASYNATTVTVIK